MGLGSEIRDRENTYSGQKNHWIPDPDPQHCYYRELIFKKKSCGSGIFSRIRIFPIPDLGSTSKNLSIQTQIIVFKLSEICSWLFIPDLDHDFYPIPDLGSRIQKHQQKRRGEKKFVVIPFLVATNFT